MSRTFVGLVGLTLASVGANAHLLLQPDPAAAAADCPTPVQSKPGHTGLASRRRYEPVRDCESSLETCRGFLKTCTEAAEQCASNVEAALPLDERWEANEEDSKPGQAFKAAATRVLGAIDDLEFEVECRGLVCRVLLRGEGRHDGMMALQVHRELHREHISAMFGGGPDETKAFFDLRPEGTPVGMDTLHDLGDRMKRENVKDTCHEQHGDAGTMKLMLRVGTPDGITVEATTGALADTPTGKCIVDRTRELAKGLEVPHPVTGAVMYMGISVG